MEFISFDDNINSFVVLDKKDDMLSQDFTSPYEILNRIEVRIDNPNGVDTSNWQIKLAESSSNKTIHEEYINSTQLKNTPYYEIKLDRNIQFKKDTKYTLSLVSKDANETSALAFYTSENTYDNFNLRVNEKETNQKLAIKIYGGEIDYWWFGLATIIAFYFLIIIFRIYYDISKGFSIRKDTFLQTLLVIGSVYLLSCLFASIGFFTDENDNIRGGLIIADGGILYKDYVTQHTPILYYICSLIALLGSQSVEQFRLVFYIFIALLWGGIYIRNVKFFGTKIVFLPIIVIASVFSTYQEGYKIISETIQGILLVALLLEYIKYIQEKNLDWKNSIIIGLCLYGSLGVAFVSIYPLFFVFLGFLLVECNYLRKNLHFQQLINRYYKLIVSVCVPFILTIIYFSVNQALSIAFNQFYTFNREVYPKYLSGFGSTVIDPFKLAIKNYFDLIVYIFTQIFTLSANYVVYLLSLIIIFTVIVTIKLIIKRKYLEALIPFLTMIFAITRGYGFHGIAAWYIAVMIIVLHIDIIMKLIPKCGKILLAGLLAFVSMSYVYTLTQSELYLPKQTIYELELKVVELTQNDVNKNIFIDAYACDSIYLYHKKRKPINTAVYMLPWYMDWFEKDSIKDLLEKNPRVVVYNPDRTCWGYGHYTPNFEEVLKNNYTQMGNSGWKYNVWIRNN